MDYEIVYETLNDIKNNKASDLLLSHCYVLVDHYDGARRKGRVDNPKTIRDANHAIAEEFGIYGFEAPLISGVNQNQRIPLLLSTFEEMIDFCKSMTLGNPLTNSVEAQIVMIPDKDEDVVRFNKKNLIKYYKFTDSEAGAYVRYYKAKPFPVTHMTTKNNKLPYGVFRTATDLTATDGSMDTMVLPLSTDYAIKGSLPTNRYSIWRSVAEDYWNSLNNDSLFSRLDRSSQMRVIVNCIRHNSFYDSIYNTKTDVFGDIKSHFTYEIAVDAVYREIIKQFPMLRAEANRQLDAKEELMCRNED